MAKRTGEFPPNIISEVRRRGVCSECGGNYDPDNPWHVHHKIWLEYGLTHKEAQKFQKSEWRSKQ